MFDDKSCPLCKREGVISLADARDYCLRDGKSDPFDLFFCNKCKVGYSIPAMTVAELSPYYPKDFEAYVPKRFFNRLLERLKYKNDLRVILKKLHVPGASMFEVGAGRGGFLFEARLKGFFVEGTEPGKEGREYAKKQFNIDLKEAYASDTMYSKRYDLIAMRHVLEHVTDPSPVLEKIIEGGLKPGGVLFLKLPRVDSWEAKAFGRLWGDLDMPRHRVHFTKEGIERLLKELGYVNVDILTEVTPLSIARNFNYVSKYGRAGIAKLLARGITLLPKFIQLIFCQGLGIIMQPFGAGRMIVLASKKETAN